MVVVMAKATRTADELPEHNVTQWVAAPPVGVPTFDLLGLVPALLLHAMWEAPRVVLRRHQLRL